LLKHNNRLVKVDNLTLDIVNVDNLNGPECLLIEPILFFRLLHLHLRDLRKQVLDVVLASFNAATDVLVQLDQVQPFGVHLTVNQQQKTLDLHHAVDCFILDTCKVAHLLLEHAAFVLHGHCPLRVGTKFPQAGVVGVFVVYKLTDFKVLKTLLLLTMS
jgi:hypothetical protein